MSSPDLIFPPAQQKPPDTEPPPDQHTHIWEPIELVSYQCSCGAILIEPSSE